MAKIFHDPDTWVVYTMLDDRDNTKDPATVEIKPVSHSEVERYSRMIAKDGDGKTMVGQATVIQNTTKKQFEEHVRNPKNFSRIGKNGEIMEMKTAGDLYEHADNDTINEIIKAMESNSKLTEGQKKTSPSPSTGQRTSNMTAENAQTSIN